MIIGGYYLLVHFKKDWIIKDTYFFVEENIAKVCKKGRKAVDRTIRDIKLKYNITL